jgi:hypothetical protein
MEMRENSGSRRPPSKRYNKPPNRLARTVNDRRTHLVGISVPMYASDDITLEKKNANNHRIKVQDVFFNH